MRAPKIRFIVETCSSATDKNGNRYHFACVTSTVTGKRLSFLSGAESNARGLVGRALGTQEGLYNTEYTLPKRQWQATANSIARHENTVTEADILALEGRP